MRNTILTIILFIIFSPFLKSQSTWPFEYTGDEFTDEALLDLRYLNESVAGENGFIQLSADGKSFVTENGKPIRFWAIGGGVLAKDFSDQELADYARFLAKMGVNLIRFHGGIHPKKSSQDITEVDTDEIDAIWKLVAAMKKEGIYTAISPFWAGKVDHIPASWDLGDYNGETKPWEVMYFEENLKEAYKKWVEVLYTEENPYTGIPLKDEPAVALIQTKNEDGVFFWTISNVKPSLQLKIETSFYTWIEEKYGDLTKAYEAWDGETMDTDNADEKRVGIYHIWDATQPQSGGKAKRLADQIQFFAEIQRDFYTEIYDHYRALGCKQLINGNNWKTADPTLLFDAERYTNATSEVMAVNRYYAPQHVGENSGWRIDPGHHYVGNSVLHYPHKLPVNIKQLDDRPFFVTESAWNLPHKYQAEGPFLIASYMSLTGVDGYFWFSPSAGAYDDYPYWDFTNFPGGQKAMYRWTVSTPGQIGMFPANALLYRLGFLKEGEVVVHEERTLSSIWNREVPLISESNSFDPNRDEWGNSGNELETEISPIAHLTGPIEVKYDGNPENNKISEELDNLIDYKNKTVKSITGELNWNYKEGIVTMNAPSAQGICGFIGEKKSFELSDVTIETENNYAAINVVAMDEKALKESEKILIQIGTIYRPSGWVETKTTFKIDENEVEGFRIDNTGKMPWRAQNTEVTITIKNPKIKSARVLDAAGYEVKVIPVTPIEGGLNILLPKEAMYIIVDSKEDQVLSIGDEQGSIEPVFQIYPNPSSDGFEINFSDNLRNDKLYQIEIRDTYGKIVIEKQLYKGKNVKLENAAIPEGIYLVTLKSGNKIVGVNKIAIQK
ncbi:T9SS type A sorting domain-containing protein [Flexithrix dorotheae]|uniref:T9SS type A sorting domain-containing protein n=1 Tax=Flexithrix dorotheae TaxID=70993 RepID=UPI00036224C0|nr:T9SS type A sorting domain-containing protein [Flexithrix dorotheae]